MKLCMMSYTMSRQGFSPEEIVSTSLKLGLTAIDWLTCCGESPRDLKKMCDDAGLKIPCYTFFAEKLLAGNTDWLDEIKKSVDDALVLGAPAIMIPTGVNDKIKRDEFLTFWIDALEHIAPVCENAGITLTVENYPGKNSAFVTAEDFLKAKRRIPQLKLTYDNGNAASGENPVTSLKKCKNDIVHVHFKDWYIQDHQADSYQQMLNGKYFKPTLIGQGDVPTLACLKALEDIKYQGYINIEYESSDIPADKAIVCAMNYLKSHFQQITQ